MLRKLSSTQYTQFNTKHFFPSSRNSPFHMAYFNSWIHMSNNSNKTTGNQEGKKKQQQQSNRMPVKFGLYFVDTIDMAATSKRKTLFVFIWYQRLFSSFRHTLRERYVLCLCTIKKQSISICFWHSAEFYYIRVIFKIDNWNVRDFAILQSISINFHIVFRTFSMGCAFFFYLFCDAWGSTCDCTVFIFYSLFCISQKNMINSAHWKRIYYAKSVAAVILNEISNNVCDWMRIFFPSLFDRI